MISKYIIQRTFSIGLLFSLALAFLASCHDDEPMPEPPATLKRIKTILVKDCNIVYNEKGEKQPPVDYYIRFGYDDRNRLITFTEEYPNYSSVISLTYLPGEVGVDMDGRDLGTYTLNAAGHAVTFERDYSKPCTYEYDASGYLINSDNGEGASTYAYRDNNLVSWTDGNTSGTFTPSSIEDKMNGPAYYQMLSLYIRGYAEVKAAYAAGLFGNAPAYLPEEGERVFTLNGKESVRKLTVTYVFDEDGYVTRQTERLTPGGICGDMYIDYEEYIVE